jgi:hypothetical protein
MEKVMRPSVLATLVFLGLIGIGIRAQTLTTQPRGSSEGHGSSAVVRHGKVIRPAVPPPPVPTLTVEGPWRPSEEGAREAALERARILVRDWVRGEYTGVYFEPTADYVEKNLLRKTTMQTFQDALSGQSLGSELVQPDDASFDLSKMRRATLTLELTPEFQTQVRTIDRDQRVRHRMGFLGVLLGLGVLGLGVLGTYIRLDEWTRGYYTNRLRLAALGVLGAGVVALLVIA